MKAQMTNGALRELVAERDWLRARNVALSESLDQHVSQYVGILERLGYDAEGNPIPKEPAAVAPAPIGEPADDSGDEALPEAAEYEPDWFDSAKQPADR